MACYVLFLLYGIVTICASFKLRKTSFIHGRYHAVRHIRCTSEEVDITQATAVESNPIILPILQKSKRGKRKPTWEDKFENDPLKSDYPTEDLHHPVDPFTKWWVCFASIESSQRRQEAWIQHIQWARRSILAQSLISDSVKATSESKFDVVPAVKVEHAYTLLHDDCMSPKSQVLIMRANHSSFVHDFIRSEPLASHQAVRPWQVFELRSEEHSVHKDEEDDWKDFLCGDVSDPYMFLAINSKSADRRSTGPQLREGTLDKSLGYHLQCAGAPYVPPQLLLETSTIRTGTTVESKVVRTAVGTPPRVVMLGRLHHTAADFDVQSVSEIPQSQSAPAGQLLLFNAKTRAEAMRYLSMDPVARSAQNSAGMPELFDTMMLSAVNIQDVSGLHHMMPRTFGAKTQLDQIHFLDPEDLLQAGEQEGVVDLPSLPSHFEENRRLLEALEKHGVSHRYTRMDENELLRANPATVGVVASAVGESSSSSGVDGAAEEDGENQLAEVSEEDLEEGWGTTSEEDE